MKFITNCHSSLKCLASNKCFHNNCIAREAATTRKVPGFIKVYRAISYIIINILLTNLNQQNCFNDQFIVLVMN